ncbi:MAG: hypothetical protein WC052_06010 [Patescibacteria group bacterium]
MARAFFDKDPNANLENGLLYHAAGLIDSTHMVNDETTLGGKDYLVTFIDPWGRLQHAWRAKDEIVTYELCEGDAQILQAAFDALETKP